MKKIRLWIVAVVLIFVSVFSLYFFSSFWNRTEVNGCLTFNEKRGELTAHEDEIKILHLTDVQIKDYLTESVSLRALQTVVKTIEPDLIVLTGDNLGNDGETKHLKIFIDFMDEFKVPWAVVMGNHDYTSTVPMDVQAEEYDDGKYCLFKEGKVKDSYGNYRYDIVRNGKKFFSLLFMDSKQEGFETEHVDWYKRQISQLGNIPNVAFFHIPTAETAEAAALYQQGLLEGSGELNEKVGAQAVDVGFFAEVQKHGTTKAFFYGHDHINNAFFEYGGVQLYYGLKTGETSYYRDDMQGGNLITLTTDGNFQVERVFI